MFARTALRQTVFCAAGAIALTYCFVTAAQDTSVPPVSPTDIAPPAASVVDSSVAKPSPLPGQAPMPLLPPSALMPVPSSPSVAAKPAVSTDSVKSRDTSGIFDLGTITVYGQRTSKAESLGHVVDKKTIEDNNAADVARALQILPGVTLADMGPRNEAQVYLRGFNSQQVGLFLDGIPIYVPYDGNVDLARFTTFDVGQLTVEKGFSSILYGPNTMGGVINIVGRKPVSPLDIVADAGWKSENEYDAGLSVGSRIGSWYELGSVSYLNQDSYRLSADYQPSTLVQNKGGQNGDERNNSYREDLKGSFRVGYNPQEGDEISVVGQFQHGVKGVPPYAGADTTSNKWRYWQWPYWDKYSVYLIGKWQFGKYGYIRAPLYFDNFQNSLYAYDDSTYSAQKRRSSFRSAYNDYSYGGTVEYGVGLFPGHTINDSAKVSIDYKNDFHSEENISNDTARASTKQAFVDAPEVYFRDYTMGVGIEDAVRFGQQWTVVGGLAYNYRKTITADNLTQPTPYDYVITGFDKPEMSAVDGQLALYYRPTEGHSLSLSISRRTRFPTIKDRYSYRLGTAIPNPNLKPEYALHYELAYQASPIRGLTTSVSFFEEQLYDVIQSVSNVGPKGESQLQNTGRARFAGYETDETAPWAYPAPEVSVAYTVPFTAHDAPGVTVWANGSYIVRRNLTTPSIQFVDVPREEVRGGFDFSPVTFITMSLDMQYESGRVSTSDGKFKTDPFTLFNVRLKVPVESCTFYAGVTNATDVNYSLEEGYPEEGRAYYARLAFDLHSSRK